MKSLYRKTVMIVLLSMLAGHAYSQGVYVKDKNNTIDLYKNSELTSMSFTDDNQAFVIKLRDNNEKSYAKGTIDLINTFEYGESISVIEIKTGNADNITENSASICGNCINTRHASMPIGLIFDTTTNLTDNSPYRKVNTTGNTYDVELTGLSDATTYYYQAYTYFNGRYYKGEIKSFTTEKESSYLSCPDDHHPHLIDLGLPSGTKWACCNVGASNPEGYGNYYAWGETHPKSVYIWETYQYGYYNYDGDSSHMVNIGSDIAGTDYDAATVNWGAPWCMPSLEQCKELINNCTFSWTTQNGVYGRKLTGKNSGTIFLPAAGRRWDSSLESEGSGGNYWSSSFNENPLRAYYLWFGIRGLMYTDYIARSFGHTVRPVRSH